MSGMPPQTQRVPLRFPGAGRWTLRAVNDTAESVELNHTPSHGHAAMRAPAA